MRGPLGRHKIEPPAPAQGFASGSNTTQILGVQIDPQLSFALCLKDGGMIELINDTMEKWAPRGAIDQLGHSLEWIIHVFMEADDNAKVLMAKWDIQDGFWRLNCRKGEE
jgi:hypothetical protein